MKRENINILSKLLNGTSFIISLEDFYSIKNLKINNLYINDFLQTDHFYNWFGLTNESLFKTEYLGIFIFFIISFLLASIIIILSYLFSAKNPETEKLSTYECGFEPYEDSRHTVNIKFCILAVLFIIFDLEIVYLIPWSINLAALPSLGFWSMFEFIVELGVGVFYIWIVQALEWED
jgi:NADH-quinone oxidoreductase subunit A